MVNPCKSHFLTWDKSHISLWLLKLPISWGWGIDPFLVASHGRKPIWKMTPFEGTPEIQKGDALTQPGNDQQFAMVKPWP